MIAPKRYIKFAILSAILLLSVKVQAEDALGINEANRMIGFQRRKCLSKMALSCFLQPTTGNNVTGIVHFTPEFRVNRRGTRCLAKIEADVSNLTPGLHGFHIHTFGDIRVADGSSLGGHFTNPQNGNIPHGLLGDRLRHWGDFGNLLADKNGVAVYRRVDRIIKLEGIIGRGIIVHAVEDKGRDFQPTGGSGPRQASCVIGVSNPGL